MKKKSHFKNESGSVHRSGTQNRVLALSRPNTVRPLPPWLLLGSDRPLAPLVQQHLKVLNKKRETNA